MLSMHFHMGCKLSSVYSETRAEQLQWPAADHSKIALAYFNGPHLFGGRGAFKGL